MLHPWNRYRLRQRVENGAGEGDLSVIAMFRQQLLKNVIFSAMDCLAFFPTVKHPSQ